MKVIEANEGRKVEYEENGSWLNFDDQISLNLKRMEADHDVHVDITADAFGRLQTGEGVYYVAQLTIPARQYEETEIENPDYVEPGEGEEADEFSGGHVNQTITKKDPVPFSMDNVTLTLYALKEGVL
ncbi:hypothetical protein D3Z51_05895 [Clostridiaceae bacterium]|uniref:hypothetical protein n=1 Tax=Enterocloster bolteae TaxID=208479 RepID=UPI000EC58D0F|nr:hypothetical protein [Enterocloster bolteae]NBH71560.1 hypothetical protein [Clostridiaceae bacterium]RKI16075.1 hypothetical protein D7V81_05410 [bacterium 1XD21-70]